MNNIDPQTLALLMSGQGTNGFQLGRGNAIWDPNLSADQQNPNAFEQVIYGNTSKDGWTTNNWDTWNKDGTYRGSGSGDSDALSTLKFLAAAAAGYFGGSALAGAGEGAAAAGAAGGSGASGGLQAGSLMEALGGTSAAGGGTAAAAGGAQAGGLMEALGGASAAGGGTASAGAGTLGSAASGAKSLADALGGAKGVATVAGGIAGALDSGDKTQSTNRDPWAPAQDFLRQQIGQGQTLATQYQQQPFSQAQQTAYGNLGGLLDTINANAGGLLSGFNANASGANNYDRSNPRRALAGAQPMSQMNLSAFMPGLLGNFGTRKG